MRVVSDQVEQELAKGVEAERVRDAAAIICEALALTKDRCSSVRADIVYLMERGEVVHKGGVYRLLSAEELRILSRRCSGRWGDFDRKSRTKGARHRRVNAPRHTRRRRDEPPVHGREYVAAPSHNEDDAWWNALPLKRKHEIRQRVSAACSSGEPQDLFLAALEEKLADLLREKPSDPRTETAKALLCLFLSRLDSDHWSPNEIPAGTSDEIAELEQVYCCGCRV